MIEVKEIEIQMNFTIPDLISQGSRDKDKIIVEMLPEIFSEELTYRPGSKVKIESEDYIFEHKLDRQASKSVVEATETIKAALKSALFGFASSNAVFGFFFSSIL